MVLEREKEIQSFVPKEYWTITAQIDSLQAKYEKNQERRIFSKETAEKIVANTKGKPAVVETLTVKEKTEQQPLPYDLTELQRDANRRFGFSAKKTLNVLQKLYEQHKLVTYPRTDSRYLTTDMKNTMIDRIESISGAFKEEVQPVLRNKGRSKPIMCLIIIRYLTTMPLSPPSSLYF